MRTRQNLGRLALLAALLLLATACGGGGGSADGAGRDAAAEEPASEGGSASEGDSAAAGGAGGELSGELVIWHYYDEGAGGLYDLIGEWETRFEEAHPEVDVTFEYQPYDEMVSRTVAAAAAGEGPDLLLPTGVFLPEMVAAGALQPLDELWEGYEDSDQFPAEVQDANLIDDQRYAVQAFANVLGIFYNEDILTEIGVEPPTSLDELEEAFQAALDAGYTPFTTSGTTGAGGEFWLTPWLFGAGWTYDEADDPAAAEILGRIEGWREAGYFSTNDATGFNSNANFVTGDYAFSQDGNWNLSSFEEDADFEYGVAVFPGVERAAVGGEVIALGAGAEDPELAWAFATEILLSQDGARDVAGAGSVPLRQDMLEDPAVTENEDLAQFAEVASQSIGPPLLESTGEISEVLGGAWNELIAGTTSADEAAQRIATEVPPLVEGS